MLPDIQTFVRACIHCLSRTGGEKVPRSFGPSVHCISRNDLIQVDYIEITPSRTGEKYVLMLRDDHSDYKRFFAFANTAAGNAAQAFIDWWAAFGVQRTLMSDRPTHFKMRLFVRSARMSMFQAIYSSIFALAQWRC